MSEFRIVKCKKCDAALTEINGKKLTSCVQCGYSFSMTTNKNKSPHTISNRIKNTPEYKRYLNKIRNNNNSKTSSKPVGETTESKKSSMPLLKKKKSNPIGTIIVWIIIFNVVRSIFFN